MWYPAQEIHPSHSMTRLVPKIACGFWMDIGETEVGRDQDFLVQSLARLDARASVPAHPFRDTLFMSQSLVIGPLTRRC